MTQVRADPAPPLTRWQRIVAPAYTSAGLGLATIALHLRDPHDQGAWGLCPSAAMGVWCPGCGGLRAVNDLTNGHLLAAASSNLAFVVALPFLVLGFGVWAVDRWRGTRREVPMSVIRPTAYVVVALVVAFTVLRNLAIGSWLAP